MTYIFQIRHIYSLLIMTCFTLHSTAQSLGKQEMSGFRYSNEAAPTGKEWESPGDLALNKEYPHAYFFSFGDLSSAKQVLPENSSYWQSLNGTWKFHWVKHPDERPANFHERDYDVSTWDDVPVPMSWNIYGVQKDGSLKYGVPIYVNQQVIFQHPLN
jgi:beta-galactosidase